jgi:hypothetical protein
MSMSSESLVSELESVELESGDEEDEMLKKGKITTRD